MGKLAAKATGRIDVLLEALADRRQVAAIEGLDELPHQLHVLLRHRLLPQPGRLEGGLGQLREPLVAKDLPFASLAPPSATFRPLAVGGELELLIVTDDDPGSPVAPIKDLQGLADDLLDHGVHLPRAPLVDLAAVAEELASNLPAPGPQSS